MYIYKTCVNVRADFKKKNNIVQSDSPGLFSYFTVVRTPKLKNLIVSGQRLVRNRVKSVDYTLVK